MPSPRQQLFRSSALWCAKPILALAGLALLDAIVAPSVGHAMDVPRATLQTRAATTQTQTQQQKQMDLQQKSQQLEAQNAKIDQGLAEAKAKFDNATQAATTSLVMGVVGATLQVGAAGAAAGQPAQTTTSSPENALRQLTDQRQQVANEMAKLLRQTQQRKGELQDASKGAALNQLSQQLFGVDQQISKAAAQVKTIKDSEAAAALAEAQKTSTQLDQAKKQLADQQANQKNAKAGDIRSALEQQIAGTKRQIGDLNGKLVQQTDTAQKAKQAETAAAQTYLGITAGHARLISDAITSQTSELKGKKPDSTTAAAEDQLRQMTAARDVLNKRISDQTGELKKLKQQEADAANSQVKHLSTQLQSVSEQIAARGGQKKTTQATDETKSLMGLRDAINKQLGDQKQQAQQASVAQKQLEQLQSKTSANKGAADQQILNQLNAQTKGSADVVTLVTTVMRETRKSANDDMRAAAQEMQKLNKQKETQRSQMEKLRDAQNQVGTGRNVGTKTPPTTENAKVGGAGRQTQDAMKDLQAAASRQGAAKNAKATEAADQLKKQAERTDKLKGNTGGCPNPPCKILEKTTGVGGTNAARIIDSRTNAATLAATKTKMDGTGKQMEKINAINEKSQQTQMKLQKMLDAKAKAEATTSRIMKKQSETMDQMKNKMR